MSSSGLTVASYNIKSLDISTTQVIEVLRELDADLVAIQEVPRRFRKYARMREVARAAGYEVIVSGGYLLGAVTCAILAKPAVARSVVSAGHKVLPLDPWLWSSYWKAHGLRWMSRRGFGYVDLGDYVFIGVHMGLAPDERTMHRNIMLNFIKDMGPHRCIVAGDINEGPGEPSWRAFERPLRDSLFDVTHDGEAREFFTFPTRRPKRRIDAIFVGSSIEVSDFRVHTSAATALASDHLPIIAKVR